LEITSEKVGEVLVVRVAGELDLDTARDFRHRVDADLDRFDVRDVVLDFTGVTFVDSSGLGALLGRYRTISERGGRLAMAGLQPHVARLLELSGVKRVIAVHPRVEDSLAALGRSGAAWGGDAR